MQANAPPQTREKDRPALSFSVSGCIRKSLRARIKSTSTVTNRRNTRTKKKRRRRKRKRRRRRRTKRRRGVTPYRPPKMRSRNQVPPGKPELIQHKMFHSRIRALHAYSECCSKVHDAGTECQRW